MANDNNLWVAYPSWGVSGIYAIVNGTSGNIYVGSAVNMLHRWHCHRTELRRGTHPNKYLQASFDRSPLDFEFIILEEVSDKGSLLKREQFWMDFYKSYKRESGYNLRPKAHSNFGMKFSEQARKNMGDASRARGWKWDEQHREKMRNLMKKRMASIPLSKKQTRLGKKNSPESNRKMVQTKIRLGLFHKPILELNRCGQTIATFSSPDEVVKSTNALKSSVLNCLSGRSKTVTKRIFRYA